MGSESKNIKKILIDLEIGHEYPNDKLFLESQMLTLFSSRLFKIIEILIMHAKVFLNYFKAEKIDDMFIDFDKNIVTFYEDEDSRKSILEEICEEYNIDKDQVQFIQRKPEHEYFVMTNS